MVTEHDLDEGRVYPPLSNILQVSIKMATQIGGFAYRENMALVYPEPIDKEEHIRKKYYSSYPLFFMQYLCWRYFCILKIPNDAFILICSILFDCSLLGQLNSDWPYEFCKLLG